MLLTTAEDCKKKKKGIEKKKGKQINKIPKKRDKNVTFSRYKKEKEVKGRPRYYWNLATIEVGGLALSYSLLHPVSMLLMLLTKQWLSWDISVFGAGGRARAAVASVRPENESLVEFLNVNKRRR